MCKSFYEVLNVENMKTKVKEYVEPVLRFCLKRLADRSEAEELSQEILTQILKGIQKYKVNNMDAWVWQIAHNRYARYINCRAKNVEVHYGDEYILDNYESYDLEVELVVKEECQSVFTTLHSLSDMYRKIMVDYYVHELSVANIAEKYDIPSTTVKWRLHSGREKIKERMGKMDRLNKVYDRINWNTTTCNGNMDSNIYLHSQVARAICLAAYEKPLSVEEISLATGLPTMYIEDELPHLIFNS